MTSHIHIGVGDFERAVAFHSAVLAVDRCYEDAPGLQPHYHADYYGACFHDPDGDELCACCHQPETVR